MANTPPRPGKKPPGHKPDTRNKRETGEIHLDRSEIAKLWCRGVTQHDIARRISALRAYTISRTLVSQEIAKIQAEWREDRAVLRDEWVHRLLHKYGHIETELWERWEQSKKQIVRTTQKQIVGKPGEKAQAIEASVTTEQGNGDMAVMRAIMEVQVSIRQLLGLDQARKMHLTGDDGQPLQAGLVPIDVEPLAPRVVVYLPENGRGDKKV